MDESSERKRQPPLDLRLLEILVCPLTKGPLRYDHDANALISQKAGLAYPVRDGIPIMLPEEARQITVEIATRTTDMALIETVVGAFVKEGVSYLAGSLKGITASRRSIARRFYALYQALLEVQDAYETTVKWNSPINIDEYDKLLRIFNDRIDDLQHVMNIYSSDLYPFLEGYSSMNIAPDPAVVMRDNLKWQNVDHSEFLKARSELQEFIKSNFKMEDLI